jgi:trehalose 6-phosphate phosphatase
VLLCLDYDGTISDIAREPSLARPVSGAVEALELLAAHHLRIAVALISGRTVADLRSLITIPPGIALAGVHGLELLDEKGNYEVARNMRECEEDLQRVRSWLNDNLPRGAGFVIEDKGLAIALHYRQAARPIAHYLRDSFEQFIGERTSSLKPRHGKMVLEAVPKAADKAIAVRTLRQRVGPEFKPVYFGDDLTDEDAFTELQEQGIGVLVGRQRKSAARYRVDNPAAVVGALKSLGAALSTQ